MLRLSSWTFVAGMISLSSCGQPLALRRVVLYQNGIAYFERAGTLRGDRYRMSLRPHEVGDVLKTLLVVDSVDSGEQKRAVSVAMTPSAAKEDTKLDLILSQRGSHDLTLAYAAPTPVWRPAYRVVLPEGDSTEGLLQAWAIVDNASAEPWERVEMVLATGAPLSFAMDLQTPRFVARPDLSGQLVQPVATGLVESERTLAKLENQPAPDTDHDGIPDETDRCPNEPEVYNGSQDDDGCPDRGRVIVSAAKLTILDKIFFPKGVHEVQSPSAPILDAIAATLSGNPQITKVQLTGHACGNEKDPAALSERRAEAVLRQLLRRGVERSRLSARGASDSQPIAPGRTEEGCAKNRRVEFLVTESPVQGNQHGGDVDQNSDGKDRPQMTASALSRSAGANATFKDVAGTTRYQIHGPVTIPKGASAMVSVLTRPGGTEDIYLYRPDGNVRGSQNHPMRAARIHVDRTLQPGPVAVFSAGSFVGEGMLGAMHKGETALIPYALDSSASVQVRAETEKAPHRLVSIRSGQAIVEDNEVQLTHYGLRFPQEAPKRVFFRHHRTPEYEVKNLPADTETGLDAYLIPLALPKAKGDTELVVREHRTRRRTVYLKDTTESLQPYLAGLSLSQEQTNQLAQFSKAQGDARRASMEAAELRKRHGDLKARGDELRENLRTIEKMESAAALRADLLRKLTDNEKKSDELQKQLIARGETEATARLRLQELAASLEVIETIPQAR